MGPPGPARSGSHAETAQRRDICAATCDPFLVGPDRQGGDAGPLRVQQLAPIAMVGSGVVSMQPARTALLAVLYAASGLLCGLGALAPMARDSPVGLLWAMCGIGLAGA